MSRFVDVSNGAITPHRILAGCAGRYMTTPKISKVTPKVRTIDEQLTSFETFIDLPTSWCTAVQRRRHHQ